MKTATRRGGQARQPVRCSQRPDFGSLMARGGEMADPFTSLFSAWNQSLRDFVFFPTTNWQRFFNPQVVFNYNPEDQAVESHVLSRVGSYGSQLSRIIDAVAVLESQIDTAKLTAPQKTVLKDFDTLRKDAGQAVAEFRAQLSVDDLLEGAKALRARDPAGAPALADRLDAVLRAKAADSPAG
jgi:hypothetical protein